MLLVIFVVQTNESVVSKAKTFLLLGGENLDNVAKEIEYDSDMALASSMNHILSKFEFDSYKLLTEPDNLTCIVGKKVKANESLRRFRKTKKNDLRKLSGDLNAGWC